MHAADHYREAERLLELAESTDWTTEHQPYRDVAIAAAQAHATLAHVGAVVEASAAGELGLRIGVPNPADPELGDRPYPGTPWGRAFYGDRHLTTTDKDS